MAWIGVLCHGAAVPGPDFSVVYARQCAANAVLVWVSIPGLAVEPLDPPDCLNPKAWELSGPEQPIFVTADSSQAFRVYLDASIPTGALRTVGLASGTQDATGLAPTLTTEFAFTGYRVTIPENERVEVGADLRVPVVAAGGDVSVDDRINAYRARVERIVSAVAGTTSHIPTFGNPYQAKRSYGPQRAALLADQVKRAIVADADTLRAYVDVSQSDTVATMTITATHRNGGRVVYQFKQKT